MPLRPVWERWVRQPQKFWLRRALFQLHLWLGLAIGLHVVVLSVSGSVLVYRLELNQRFATALPTYQPDRPTLTPAQIRAAAEARYPDHAITYVAERVNRRVPAFSVTAVRGSETLERFFDPFTAADLGPTFTTGQRFILWVARLHDELLLDQSGRWWNGFLAGVFTVLVLTGIVVWWPGITRWRRSLTVRWQAGWSLMMWELHSALGIWLCVFLLMWGVSGVYLGIPEPFNVLVDRLSAPSDEERLGDVLLGWLAQLHFGRFRGNPYASYLKALWATIGIAPALMLCTGTIMWWNRVVRRRL